MVVVIWLPNSCQVELPTRPGINTTLHQGRRQLLCEKYHVKRVAYLHFLTYHLIIRCEYNLYFKLQRNFGFTSAGRPKNFSFFSVSTAILPATLWTRRICEMLTMNSGYKRCPYCSATTCRITTWNEMDNTQQVAGGRNVECKWTVHIAIVDVVRA